MPPFLNFLRSAPGIIGKVVQGILPSASNYLFGTRQQQSQNEFNERMIREQNAYNSPLATKNRMIAAGITPKAAEIALTGSPSIGSQQSVATAAPWQGSLPGTDFTQGLSSAFANDLVDSQAIQQKINNHSQDTVNQLNIQNLQKQIYSLGLSNRGKETDLHFQPFIRNLERSNLSLQNLFGLFQLCQYQLALNENPYVNFYPQSIFDSDGSISTAYYPSPVVPTDNGKTDEESNRDLANRKQFMRDNREKVLQTYENEISNQLTASGIDKSRLNYISKGMAQEATNHLKALDVESLRLLAQGKIEELRQKMAETGLGRKDWLWRVTDTFSAFGPLMSALMSVSGAYSNVATGISRTRLSNHDWNFNPTTTSFSW